MSSVRKALSRSKARAATLHLTVREASIVLAIYLLSRYNLNAVALYVASRNAVRQQPSHSAAEVRELTESLYLETSIDELIALECGEPGRHARVRHAAVSFLAELRTVEWLESQNMLGAAPSSAAMASKYLMFCEAFHDSRWDGALARAVHNKSLNHSAGRYLRKWSADFRERWNVAFRVLSVKPPAPCAELAAKVKTLWQWVFWLRHCCIGVGKIPILLNLDESYIPWSPGSLAGNVLRKTRVTGAKRRRGGFTYTPIICTNEALQPLLPRFLVAKRSVLSARAVRTVSAQKPDNLHIWREASAWSTVRVMKRVLEELSHVMAAFPAFQAILLLDCHASHIHPDTVRAANNSNIWMAVIPAGLTGLIQPLDTLAFSAFKFHLKQQFQMGLGESETLPEDFLRRVFALSQTFFNGRKWKAGFASLGLEPEAPVRLSRDLRPYQEALALVPSSAPTGDQLASIFPRNYVLTDDLFDAWTRLARGRHLRLRLV
ncbi:unnamed protein product [Symbiodinium sp. CCMP2592]|nr:unnamed protein product [Symbiodinium sp. CCMP2592]